MEYMFAITVDESLPAPGPGEPGFAEGMAAWADYTRMLMERGHWLSGASLQPSATATTVVKPFGGPSRVLDGPYAETKEVLGGYYVVRADDLDAALELAAAMPLPAGSVEVRPLMMRPDASGTPTAVAG